MNPLLPRGNGESDNQSALELDDRTGLRVVRANFTGESKFSWDLFEGYDCLRVLTYSASTNAIVRMLDSFSFETFECVFGYEGTLRDIRSILAFQKVVVGDTRAAIMGIKGRTPHPHPRKGSCRAGPLQGSEKVNCPRKAIPSLGKKRRQACSYRLRQLVRASLLGEST